MKKHIVCLGDSNTHGYSASPDDCADGPLLRFNEEERWTCLLGKQLGEDYLVLEEGLSGRTTVFSDPLYEGLSALGYLFPCLTSHEPVSLLVVMLGTNDTKERFHVSAECISLGMERLVRVARNIECWGGKQPNILIVAPPPIGEGVYQSAVSETMGRGCVEKSRELARYYAQVAERQHAHFLDAAPYAEFNTIDCMHLTRKGHRMLAEKLAEVVRGLA